MKTISAGLTTSIAAEVTTKAHCWKITRRDATAYYFTDHDADLLIDGNTYQSAVGYQQTAISADPALTVNNTEVSGYFDNAALTADDLRSGLFDFAEAQLFVVDWSDLSLGKMKLVRAYLGEVRSTPSGIFTTEMRGMVQRLYAKVADVYTPECRADLGDTKCQVDLTSFTHAETVTAVTDASTFVITNTGAAPDDYYNYGLVQWTSGANNGRFTEIKNFDTGTNHIDLAYPMPHAIVIGDTCNMIAGCDKKHDTCKVKFNNMVNRRAEDFIPGVDAVIQTPNAPPSTTGGKK